MHRVALTSFLLAAALAPHAATAQCPSTSYIDPASTLPPPGDASAPVAGIAPTPTRRIILASASSEVAIIPRQPLPPALDITSQLACPHTAAGLALWHDPATWASMNRGVPASPGDNITLPSNTSVLLSSCSLPAGVVFGFITIPATSTLVFADANITLRAAGITVAGAMRAGSSTCRLRSYVDIILYGTRPVDVSVAPPEYVKGIAVTGTLDLHGALYAATWSRLAVTAGVNDTWIYVQDGVNWEAGQAIVIATTGVKDARDYHENELRTIRSVVAMPAQGGITAIQIDRALVRSHYAGPEYQAEVGLLSRRITVQGAIEDSPPTDVTPVACSDSFFSSLPCPNSFLTGYGAHVMLRGVTAIGRISGVAFIRAGQTNVLGRYPVHFHMLGDAGSSSFLQDSSIWNSFYRCVSVHGTNGVRVSRNVAHDAIGHCYYLEDGVENGNTFAFNFASLVHVIGYPAAQPNSSGQFMVDVPQTPNLLLPADCAASGFYITNANNTFLGNAASGGWSGFSFPGLPTPLAFSRGVNMVPMSQPTGVFEGNTAHSSGYWWNQAGCMYVGGLLSYPSSSSNQLVYNPGRITAGRNIVNNGFFTMNNTKVALCNVGVLNWGSQEEIRNFEAHDVMRAATIFGRAYVTNMLITCRSTGNVPAVPGTSWNERYFASSGYSAFQWYDTGQSHIITNVTFRRCMTIGSRVARSWELLTHSDQFLPSNMQITRNVRYDNFTLNMSISSLISMSVPSPISTSNRLQNWFDADGSASLRPGPTIIGSMNAGLWWRFDMQPGACISRPSWYMWLCDAGAPSRVVGSIVLSFDSVLQANVGGPNCTNGGFLPCVPVGYVSHVGFDASPNSSLPITLGAMITGPLNGFGWWMRFVAGTPRVLTVTSAQLRANDTMLLVIAYPPGTTFNVTMSITSSTCASWCTPANGCLCRWPFRAVASVAAVRNSTDTYFFDGNNLYVRMTGHLGWNLGTAGKWVIPTTPGFIREGMEVPYRWSSNLVITASCDSAGGLYCAVTPVPPSPPCASGAVVAYDTCLQPSPSPSPTPSPTASPPAGAVDGGSAPSSPAAPSVSPSSSPLTRAQSVLRLQPASALTDAQRAQLRNALATAVGAANESFTITSLTLVAVGRVTLRGIAAAGWSEAAAGAFRVALAAALRLSSADVISITSVVDAPTASPTASMQPRRRAAASDAVIVTYSIAPAAGTPDACAAIVNATMTADASSVQAALVTAGVAASASGSVFGASTTATDAAVSITGSPTQPQQDATTLQSALAASVSSGALSTQLAAAGVPLTASALTTGPAPSPGAAPSGTSAPASSLPIIVGAAVGGVCLLLAVAAGVVFVLRTRGSRSVATSASVSAAPQGGDKVVMMTNPSSKALNTSARVRPDTSKHGGGATLSTNHRGGTQQQAQVRAIMPPLGTPTQAVRRSLSGRSIR